MRLGEIRLSMVRFVGITSKGTTNIKKNSKQYTFDRPSMFLNRLSRHCHALVDIFPKK